jgi:phospholipid/cholesterol/gamma-HCH transport system permease protein
MGEVSELAARTFRAIFGKPREGEIFLQQLEEIGLRTLPVVALTAAFGGLVFGLQSYYGFHKYVGQGTEAYGGPIIAVGLVRELIPILVGLMVAGRVGSSMAAEIGTDHRTDRRPVYLGGRFRPLPGRPAHGGLDPDAAVLDALRRFRRNRLRAFL